MQIEPLGDGVLIKRTQPIDRQESGSIVLIDDPRKGNEMILREGIVLAVGPGKWIEGEWWKVGQCKLRVMQAQVWPSFLPKDAEWEWIPGYREIPQVKTGDRVIFNARWNDLANDELKGSGCDGKGPLIRPLSWRFDEEVHLVQEADIAGILS